jgi:hypothetical protein
MSAPTADQVTATLTSAASAAQEVAETTFRAVTDAVETTMQASFDVAQRVLDGQRAVLAAFLPKK